MFTLKPEGNRRGFRGGDEFYRGDDWYEGDDFYVEDNKLQSEYVVHMRGLPFKATDDDISNVSSSCHYFVLRMSSDSTIYRFVLEVCFSFRTCRS